MLGLIKAISEAVSSSVQYLDKDAYNILQNNNKHIKDVNELYKNPIEETNRVEDILQSKMDIIQSFTPEQLEALSNKYLENPPENLNSVEKSSKLDNVLTEKERVKISEDSGWSKEIVDNINSIEEYNIYKNAELQNGTIDGKECLIRDDIDWDKKDAMGRTNRERANMGLSPINKDGKVIELHHIGQHADSPLAELTPEEHRGKGNDTILHDKNKISEIDRGEFAKERAEYWEVRANDEAKE